MPALDLLNFLGLNLAVAVSSALLVFWLNDWLVSSWSKLILSCFVIFCSQIIIVEILLGMFGVLSYINVSIFVYCIFVVSALIFWRDATRNLKIKKPEMDKAALLALLAVLGPVVFLLFLKVFNVILQIPLEYDGVAYHLPFIVEWLNTGSLMKIYYSAFAGPIGYYPSNYELLDLWTILPFRNDFFVGLVNFPLFVFLGMALYRILKNLGAGKITAIVSMAIPFYMPIFLHQAGLPLVDLFFVLTFVIAVYYLQEIIAGAGSATTAKVARSDFLLFGLSIGLFIGTKYLGLVYGAVILLVALGAILFRLRAEKRLILSPILLISAGVFLTGAFFYIRNWIDSGNPLFPVDINLFGVNIFEGYRGINENLVETSLMAHLGDPGRIKEILKTYFYITGPYGLIAIFFPVVTFAFLAYQIVLNKLKKISNKREIFTAGLLLAGSLLYFYLYIKAPYTNKDLPQNVRYSMPFLILGTLSIGYTVSRIKFLKPGFYFATALIFVCCLIFPILDPPSRIALSDRSLLSYSLLLEYKEYLFLVVAGIFAALCAMQILQYGKSRLNRIFATALLAFFVFTGLYTAGFAYTERELLRSSSADFWLIKNNNLRGFISVAEWFNKNAPNAKIAYSGFNYHYHLYGRDLSREVDYVNINECAECRYVDYKNIEKSIRRDPNFSNWMTNLKAKDKQYLVVDPEVVNIVRNYEYEWAMSHPGNFQGVFNVNNTYVFRITF